MRDEVLEPVEVTGSDSVKRRALGFLEKAFDDAEAEGVPVDAVAHAALFAALTTLVECFGEDQVAKLAGDLPGKISSGGYTINRVLQ
ncbi:MAG TPA: hypothetical protein VMP03_08255 [Methylomirabilota bacterium]|nr:hypothetical protein [Methylomirabilota bacterium]